ncbi:DUF1622 domain-containing protein [Amycolatopsis rhabdoformis]|uniref:DUF1622 domain-containing protein n=1 Tax=Amycolatopsis rhabdoformis TaxID=1448059 RepID=A0ABZ1IBF3_9PSEU|nr:DUF1622 domain-containing protein [Amycolatopsis rhabdoformis]WSE31799.1 DUF1622 domain-containing protein [Amycolatopsis rhabdoformis]
MSFTETFDVVAYVIEGLGVTIMAIGLVVVLVRYAVAALRRGGSYDQLRVHLGRVILLGLEILIIGDIIRTVIVDSSLQNVAVLGLIVLIRTVLSFALEVEISGRWPWQAKRGPRPPA